jgi:hypothetical protein
MIDEDNCVLDEGEMCVIDLVFKTNIGSFDYSGGQQNKDMLDKLFLKITKLNELAKEKE